MPTSNFRVPLTAALFLMLAGGCAKDDGTATSNPPASPAPARGELNIVYGPHPYQRMDAYLPEGYTGETPVVFLIHGGGFIAGLKEDFTTQALTFRGEDFVVLNVSHRLVDTAGLFLLPPVRKPSDVRVADEVADIHAAVEKYRSMAPGWGTGTARMYMAGHSAGAILTLLYTQGDYNDDGRIRAGAAWAGATDLSIPHDSLLDALDPRYKELMWRASGHEMKAANNLAYMAISPYWQANNNAGNPTFSAWPENNSVIGLPGEVDYGLQNTQNFHTLLRTRGIAEQLTIYPGADHGFGTPAGVWSKVIAETAAFFRAR